MKIGNQLEWELTDSAVIFRFLGAAPPRMPLGSNEPGVVQHLDPADFWTTLQECWADGSIQEIGPGKWSLEMERIYELSPEMRDDLRLPQPERLNVIVGSTGLPGCEGLAINLEVSHPTLGRLEGAVRRAGPLYIQASHPPVLMERSVFSLLRLKETGPAGSSIEDHFEYLASAQKHACDCAAVLGDILRNEDYSFPSKVGLNVVEHSPEILEIRPEVTVAEGPAVPYERLMRPTPPRIYSKPGRGGRRQRVIFKEEIREQIKAVAAKRELRGAEVPRFIENPEAYVPAGIDLEEFSKRVRGLRTLVYNSRPYLHVRRLEGGWFEGIPGIRLETTRHEGESDPAGEPTGGGPHDLSPETYRQLAQQARETGQEYVRHGDGWVRIDISQADQFHRTVEALGPGEDGRIRIPQRAILDIYENLEALEFELPPIEEVGLHIDYGEFPNPPVPSSFSGSLKPYQLDGYRWLAHLRQKGTGGLLADEMGLGKTVQVIAHLAKLAEEGELRPSLVVCPKTLITNWGREISRFFPDHGRVVQLDRGHVFADQLSECDLVLTSYDSLRHNQLELAKVDWQLLVSDEAQYAKNPTAQRTSALKALKSKHRVALTGTPVENGMIEFWCIMDFVRPGLLSSWSEFRKEHERPLVEAASERERTPLVRSLLGKLGSHYLRRLKEHVLSELPSKKELTYEATLSKQQLQLYREIARKALAGGRGAALAAITDLILLCSHPLAVIRGDGGFTYVPGECPKLDITLEKLEEIRRSGEKVIIFTRFLKTQRILQAAIRQIFGLWPDLINGEVTVNRQSIVDIFSNRDGFNVLILSHDVGGVGLNITAANHVIHYTRPWNPAKENQATDRVHRIGQEREVNVHYPIVKDSRFVTVEERLAELLEGKRALARDVLRPSAEAKINPEELLDCLDDVPGLHEQSPGETNG